MRASYFRHDTRPEDQGPTYPVGITAIGPETSRRYEVANYVTGEVFGYRGNIDEAEQLAREIYRERYAEVEA